MRIRVFRWAKRHIAFVGDGNKIRKFDIVLIPLLSLIIALVILFPRIKLNGSATEEIMYSSKYHDAGATVIFLGKDLSNEIKISGKVKTEKIGTYKIVYRYDGFIVPIKKVRTVKVIDNKKPVITLVGEKEKLICKGQKYQEEGFKAYDEYDGDITKKVKVTNLEDKIVYEVNDSSNNSYELERKILYGDKTKPEITMVGNDVLYITKGSAYNEPGFSANDNCDGKIDDKVVVSGNVDTNNVGSYTINYSVTDKAGNATTVTRKINVTGKVDVNSGISKPGVIYLTFDDGPQTGTTDVILDILKEEGVKATFFVTNKGDDNLIKREYDEGHTVALHTATHDYSIVYASADSYFNDLNIVHERVLRITGYDSRIIRFPGGSSNTVSRRYTQGIMSYLTDEVLNRGYRYYDWNISSGDAGGTTDPNQVYLNVCNNLSKNRANMVLMHDIKRHTRDALRNIIKCGKDNGYTFEPITMDTAMVRQGVNN